MKQRLPVVIPVLAVVVLGPLSWGSLKLPVAIVAPQESASREERRERWQKVPEIFALMHATSGSRVADVGAGHGFFTVRLAKTVGHDGAVFAVDISSNALSALRARLEREGWGNVKVVEGQVDDPRLPLASLDAVLINNAYHEMTAHQAMLAHIRSALKPDGRLVIVDQVSESRRDAERGRQTARHEIAPDLVEADLAGAGFAVVELQDPFIERGDGSSEAWWLIVASPADAGPARGCDGEAILVH